MIKKKVRVEKHNTKVAILFVLFVFAIILISAAFKVISVIRQSKFDGTNRFTISVSNDKNLEVVSFSPNKHSISILRLEGESNNINLSRFLKIPIDGFVKSSSLKMDKDVVGLMSSIFFNYKDVKTNLNFVDILRLILASRVTQANNVTISNISSSFEAQRVDKTVAKLFKDDEIEKENKTIKIVNATSITGLGDRLSRLITNMGGNVVQVSTQNNSQRKSIIYYNGKKNYTIEKLSKVLGFKTTEMSKQSIADITIVVGEDNQNPLSF